MRLPTPLSRRNPQAYKNQFGHVLILAGSPHMLGAAALSGLAAMRAGAGLVTLGIPAGLNLIIQKKISPVLMTLSLTQTRQGTIALAAHQQCERLWKKFQSVAIGPGLSSDQGTGQFICKIIGSCPLPLVVDADGLNALSLNLNVLKKNKNSKILTPHPGEMARLTGFSKAVIEKNRMKVARQFAKEHRVVLLLKGHRTVVASPEGEVYQNRTGNVGMATAGSGDVLTGMIAAFLAQGLSAFEAAKFGAYLHGKAGDLAAKDKTKLAMIATDIIDCIPGAIRLTKAA